MPFLDAQVKRASEYSGGWLFSTDMFPGRHAATGHLCPGKLREAVKRAAAAIGYNDANFHALRAVTKNRLDASGYFRMVNEARGESRAALGHASAQTAAPYFDAIVSYMRPLIDAYDCWLDRTAQEDEKVVRLSRRS